MASVFTVSGTYEPHSALAGVAVSAQSWTNASRCTGERNHLKHKSCENGPLFTPHHQRMQTSILASKLQFRSSGLRELDALNNSVHSFCFRPCSLKGGMFANQCQMWQPKGRARVTSGMAGQRQLGLLVISVPQLLPW